MDNESKDELFSLRLNDEGTRHLLRYIKLLRSFIVLGWIFTVIVVARDIFLLQLDYSVYQQEIMRLYYQLYPVVSLGATLAFIFQLIYAQHQAKKLKHSIAHADEKEFNSSLRYLNLSLFTSIILSAISLVMIVVDFYIVILTS